MTPGTCDHSHKAPCVKQIYSAVAFSRTSPVDERTSSIWTSDAQGCTDRYIGPTLFPNQLQEGTSLFNEYYFTDADVARSFMHLDREVFRAEVFGNRWAGSL